MQWALVEGEKLQEAELKVENFMKLGRTGKPMRHKPYILSLQTQNLITDRKKGLESEIFFSVDNTKILFNMQFKTPLLHDPGP